MARIYQPKRTSTKLLEGATAGLLGGLAFVAVMLVADLLTPLRPWWSTFWLIGSIVTGTPLAEINRFNIVTLLVGLVLHLVVFALAGIGLVQYVPLFRRFKIAKEIGGAAYGVLVFLTLYWYLLSFLNANVGANMNYLALFLASVLGGGLMGWWLKRAAQTRAATQAA
ncbi:MAG: hypothetical protein M3328_18575 [Chloroflexota bacterium]|nr:hypothetical protein [Chloroflexota bacterium]